MSGDCHTYRQSRHILPHDVSIRSISRNVTEWQVEEPATAPDTGSREIDGLGRELHRACLGAWGGSPWERPPESTHQVIEGLSQLTRQESSTRCICLACQHIWESPIRPRTCPFCGGEQIAERTIPAEQSDGKE